MKKILFLITAVIVIGCLVTTYYLKEGSVFFWVYGSIIIFVVWLLYFISRTKVTDTELSNEKNARLWFNHAYSRMTYKGRSLPLSPDTLPMIIEISYTPETINLADNFKEFCIPILNDFSTRIIIGPVWAIGDTSDSTMQTYISDWYLKEMHLYKGDVLII